MVDFLEILNSNQPNELTDNQFLKEYLQAFYLIYINEIACIKNIDSQYIAATPQFGELVGLDIANIILIADSDLPCKLAKYAQLYYKYDRAIWKHKTQMTFLDINEYANGIGIYIFHKKPILNPHTGNVVGILYYSEKYKANNMVKAFLDMHKSGSTNLDIKSFCVYGIQESKISLGAKQSEILFCMLLGLKEDKAIADFINSIKSSNYTNKTINNATKELYKKFNTNSRDSLIQLAFSENYHLSIPKTLIKYGSYPINSSETNLA